MAFTGMALILLEAQQNEKRTSEEEPASKIVESTVQVVHENNKNSLLIPRFTCARNP